MGSGLFPAFGIFHRNRYNAFPLADDVMEPYRPYVDELVWPLYLENKTQLTQAVKGELLSLLYADTRFEKVLRPLDVGLTFTSGIAGAMFHGNAEKDRVSSTGVKKMSELRLNAYRIMWLFVFFAPADPYQNRTAPRGPVSQGIGKGRFRDDAILGLRPALRLQGKYGGPYPAGPPIDAAFRNDEYPERNGQTIRRNFEFLGQGRTRRLRNTSTTGFF